MMDIDGHVTMFTVPSLILDFIRWCSLWIRLVGLSLGFVGLDRRMLIRSATQSSVQNHQTALRMADYRLY